MTRAFAATLVGFPGNDDRDAKRIAAAANAMRLTRIDHVVISHWHGDLLGGLSALAKRPERIDTSPTPGETITLGDVRVRVLVAEGPVIAAGVNCPARGHLARAPVIARRRRCPQHLARHDCQPGGGSRRPGAHDHCSRVGRRHVHGDELAKPIYENLPSAVTVVE